MRKHNFENEIINKYWDYKKNGKEVDYNKVSRGSHTSYYWLCPDCKYSWKTRVGRLLNETKGCPNCKKIEKKNQLNIKVGLIINEKELMEEWDYKQNEKIGLFPDKLSRKSKVKAFWICKKERHSWQSSIYNRVIHHRNCPYCTNQKILKGYNDLETVDPELAKEWNYEKNKLTPSEVGAGARSKFWWKCERGHEWKASVSNRHRLKVGCPYCSQSVSFPEKAIFYYLSKYLNNIVPNYRSKIIQNKEIDIFIQDMKIGIEYNGLAFHDELRDKKKNDICKKNNIKLINIIEKSKSKLYIKGNNIYYNPNNKSDLNLIINHLLNLLLNTKNVCYKIDIEKDRNKIYEIMVNDKKGKSLFNTNPELIKLWNYEKNKGLNPEMFSKGSGISVWWKCEKGHEWEASIYNVTKGHGCPYCSGRKTIIGENDIFSYSERFKRLWNYEKNKNINPKDIKPSSNLKLWWKCEKGHEWETVPYSIKNGSRCPFCSNQKVLRGFNDLETLYPNIAKEWNYERNDFMPYEVVAGSGKRAWWRCSKCNYEWETTISNRTTLGRGCPVCGRIKMWESRRK